MYNYLGHGSYGCVIEPYIPCSSSSNNKNKKNVKYISKIFRYKHDWEEEIKKQKIIKKIDSKHKFTVELISYCDLTENEFKIKEIKDYEKCNFTHINKNNYQIIYEYGGIDLSRLLKVYSNTIDVYKFMKSLINIFNGIVILDKKKYIHNDIYIKNIIFNMDTYVCKLIDFGFLVNIKDLYNQKNLGFIYQTYRYYPPEYNIFFFKNYKNINTYVFIDYIYKYIDIIKNNHIEKLYKDIINDIKTNFRVIINKHKYKGYENKINVYMLGICLFEIIIYMLMYIKDIKLPIIELCDLIKKMVCINPEQRITSKEALDIYTKLFNSNS